MKTQIEADFLFAQDSLFSHAMMLRQFEIVAGWRKIDDYLPSIQKVTSEDIRCVAKQYLTEDNRTVGILIPISKQEVTSDPPELPENHSRKKDWQSIYFLNALHNRYTAAKPAASGRVIHGLPLTSALTGP